MPPDQPAAAPPLPPPPPYYQAPPPPPAGQSGAPSATSRLRAAADHPQASAVILAILIGYASTLSAVVAWRASLASIDASRYESLSVQQQARTQQIERDLEGLIAQDLRFVNVFQEHALAARELRSQADEIRATDANAADDLDLQAQSQLDLSRSTAPFFLGAGGAKLGEDGTVTYDIAYVLRNLKEGDAELRELRTQRTPALSVRADARSISLVAVAAVIIAALLFLTIAQVSRTRGLIRRTFLVSGAVFVLIGTLTFAMVELFP